MNGSPEAVKKMGELACLDSWIAVTVVTVYEVLKVAYLSSSRDYNIKNVKSVISDVQVLDLSVEACEEASHIFYELEKSGKIIGEFGILIAAIAKANGEAILTRDQHFKSVKGIDVILW